MTQVNKILDYKALEYIYCNLCGTIKEIEELDINKNVIKCRECGNTRLVEPGWVACPHNKMTAVKCPMGGKGIVNTVKGLECLDRCFFRSRFK